MTDRSPSERVTPGPALRTITRRFHPRAPMLAVLLILSADAGGEYGLRWGRSAVVKAQSTNLVVNGGFEAPALPPGAYQVFGSIPGWAVVPGRPQFELQRRVAGDPFEGEQHCELDAFQSSTIYQDIATVPGRLYELTFAFSARPNRPTADNVLRVSWGGTVVTTLSADGTGLPNTSWEVHRFAVTGGSGTTTRLIFEDLGVSNSYGIHRRRPPRRADRGPSGCQ